MKPILDTRKPRNPFVALARSRSAGRHGGGKRRQQMQRELRGELSRLKPSP
ncbi:MAG: hypothetical protein KA711_03190 [Ideonella sp. WA131b]|jgi:hypothetical protein|nr:hypothetical protein [Ideonella sp. WA131b]